MVQSLPKQNAFRHQRSRSFCRHGRGNADWAMDMNRMTFDKNFESYGRIAQIMQNQTCNGQIERLTGVTIPYEWEHYLSFRPAVKLPEAMLKQYIGAYEGRLRAVVTFDKGRLWAESETVGLPKTKLYAADETHFFLKTMDVNLAFIKDTTGKVAKVIVDDEGEHYELKKVE